jgi:hypothetical protein
MKHGEPFFLQDEKPDRMEVAVREICRIVAGFCFRFIFHGE